MKEHSAAVDGERKEVGVHVLVWLEDATTLPRDDVTSLGQTHERTVGRVVDVVPVVDGGYAGILDAPALLHELGIDLTVAVSVITRRDGQ